MKKIFVSTLLVLLCCTPVFARGERLKRSARPVKNLYLVQLVDSDEPAEQTAKTLVEQYGGKLREVFKHGVKGFVVKATEEQALALSEAPAVELVEEDGAGSLLQVPPVSPPGWALDRINQHFLPLDGSKSTACSNPGNGVTVYIMDSGIFSSDTPPSQAGPEFGARLRYLYTYRPDGKYIDDLDHGTRVASIVGSATYGVATGANLVILKVAGPGDNPTDVSRALVAIDRIVAEQVSSPTVPRVVNMSLLYASSMVLDNKITDAISRGIVFVVGAGNGANTGTGPGRDTCTAGSPARLGLPNSTSNPSSYSTITVSATMLPGPSYSQDSRVGYANFGQCVDLFAPGKDIDAMSAAGSKVSTFEGTSAATPFVSGLAARALVALGGPYPKAASIVEDTVKSWATQGVVADAQTPDPNLFAYAPSLRCRPSGP